MNIAVEALIEISHLLGAPVGNYYPDDIKVDIYEERVVEAARIARRVILSYNSYPIQLGPSTGG
jgi:hypothetical protein